MLEDWTIYSWYCPNCKNEVAGLKNKKNQIRVRCSKCGAEMVRTVVGRRHDVIDIYAPTGMEHTDLSLKAFKTLLTNTTSINLLWQSRAQGSYQTSF